MRTSKHGESNTKSVLEDPTSFELETPSRDFYESTQITVISLDDGVAASFHEVGFHKPQAILNAFSKSIVQHRR
ncbi:hypothetical protein Tco_1419321 [Tanacetum coccineum]